ncbi:MAG: hypothetical protein ABID63_02215 [Pseudomonadota bacterium]
MSKSRALFLKPVLVAFTVIVMAISATGAWAQTGNVFFSQEERQIIADVLEVITGQETRQDKKGDKGNKGKNNHGLPPGIAMKLERGGTLPPGIAKRDLPAGLAARLPRPHPGTERLIAGNDVVLIEQGTGIILDIIRAVVRN